MIFDMLIATVPDYSAFEASLTAVDGTFTTAKSAVDADTLDVAALQSSVIQLTTDIAATGSDVTTAVSAATTEEGRITTTTSSIGTANTEITAAQGDYAAVAVAKSYWTTNAADITWDSAVNAGNSVSPYATFCVGAGETLEFFLAMSAEPNTGGGYIDKVELTDEDASTTLAES